MSLLSDLDTPRLILNQSRFDHNVSRMYAKCVARGVTIRPHVKTAKSIGLLERMRQSPMHGITVSTLQEAEYFAMHGINDILYAVTIAPNKIERALQLQRQYGGLILLVDSIEVCQLLEQQAIAFGNRIQVMIEIDVDGHRAGLLATDPELIQLARLIHDSAILDFLGLMTHAGESYKCQHATQLNEHAEREAEQMRLAKHLLAKHQLPCPCISIGSTPTANTDVSLHDINEVRAGVFVFYDLVMVNIGVCTVNDIALGVLSTVISHKKSHNRIIIDAGGLALSKDRGTAEQQKDFGYGLVVDAQTWQPIDDLVVNQANQEHGVIQLASDAQYTKLPIGKPIIILPNHACMTAAAYDTYTAITDQHRLVTYERINGW